MSTELLNVYATLIDRNQWALWNDADELYNATYRLAIGFEKTFDCDDTNVIMSSIRESACQYYRSIYACNL